MAIQLVLSCRLVALRICCWILLYDIMFLVFTFSYLHITVDYGGDR